MWRRTYQDKQERKERNRKKKIQEEEGGGAALPNHIPIYPAKLNANSRFVQGPPTPSVGATPAKKEPPVPPVTPLEKMLQDMGAIREDGSDKFFGMENVSLAVS